MSIKKRYLSRNDEYFIGFQPPDVWSKIQSDKELKKYYQQYRNHHKLVHEGKDILKKMKMRLSKLRNEIQEKESQLRMWKEKMLEGYSIIGDLSSDYDFNCSINLRKIKPKRLIMIEKGKEWEMKKWYDSSDLYGDTTKRGTKRNNPSHENRKRSMENNQGGRPYSEMIKNNRFDEELYEPERNLTIREKYYVRVEPKMKRDGETSKKRWVRNLYVGEKNEVLKILSVYDKKTDWINKDEKSIRDNLRDLYKGYVRFNIYEYGIRDFKRPDKNKLTTQHPSSKVQKWIEEHGEEIFNWMDH